MLFSIEVAMGAGPVIEQFAHEPLCNGSWRMLLKNPLHHGFAVSTTSASASDSNPRRIYVEGIGVSHEPRPCVMTVVN